MRERAERDRNLRGSGGWEGAEVLAGGFARVEVTYLQRVATHDARGGAHEREHGPHVQRRAVGRDDDLRFFAPKVIDDDASGGGRGGRGAGHVEQARQGLCRARVLAKQRNQLRRMFGQHRSMRGKRQDAVAERIFMGGVQGRWLGGWGHACVLCCVVGWRCGARERLGAGVL